MRRRRSRRRRGEGEIERAILAVHGAEV